MTKIYLICSAQSEGELYRIAEGHTDSGLTDSGRRQAAALEQRFAPVPVDRVYTSDLYRACATASAIAGPKGLPLCRRNDLREVCLGEWEGKNWGNIAYREAEQLGRFKTALGRWHVEGAEPPQEAALRMLGALEQIAAENDGKAVAVVSHSLVIRLLLAELQGVCLENLHQLPAPRSTGVSVIEAEGGRLRLAAREDTGHLGEEPPREAPDFDTDMYFHPLPWVEYGESMAEAVECVWQEAGEDRPFNKNILLDDAALLTTIVGFVEQEPAGFLQMGMEPGWITLLCTHPGCRRAGLGVQLIGQAVADARAKGSDRLRIALPPQNPYRQFFLEYGFAPAGETGEGREILEKDIRFDPGAFSG